MLGQCTLCGTHPRRQVLVSIDVTHHGVTQLSVVRLDSLATLPLYSCNILYWSGADKSKMRVGYKENM